MLVKLANQTVAATGQVTVEFRFCAGIGKRSRTIAGFYEAPVPVSGFNRCPVEDKTEQQKGKHASENSVPLN
jgi:hypothetical protein